MLRADLKQDQSIAELAGRKVIAFAGIALPEKFFAPLRAAGAILVAARPFPDHHVFAARELDALLSEVRAKEALLVTTPKDAVRLPPAILAFVTVVGVGLEWRDPNEIERLLDSVISEGPSRLC